MAAITGAGSASASVTVLCSGSSYATCIAGGHNCTNYAAYVLSAVNGAPTPTYQLGNAWQ